MRPSRDHLHALLDEVIDCGNDAIVSSVATLLNGIANRMTPQASDLLAKTGEVLGAARSIMATIHDGQERQDVIDVEAREVPASTT